MHSFEWDPILIGMTAYEAICQTAEAILRGKIICEHDLNNSLKVACWWLAGCEYTFPELWVHNCNTVPTCTTHWNWQFSDSWQLYGNTHNKVLVQRLCSTTIFLYSLFWYDLFQHHSVKMVLARNSDMQECAYLLGHAGWERPVVHTGSVTVLSTRVIQN